MPDVFLTFDDIEILQHLLTAEIIRMPDYTKSIEHLQYNIGELERIYFKLED